MATCVPVHLLIFKMQQTNTIPASESAIEGPNPFMRRLNFVSSLADKDHHGSPERQGVNAYSV
jgi:hypothetical protein